MALRERYRDWPKEALLARIAELEEQSTAQRTAHLRPSTLETAPSGSSMDADGTVEGTKGKGKKEKKPKEFDFGAAGCRKIALRFSYDGAGYSGLAAQNTSVPARDRRCLRWRRCCGTQCALRASWILHWAWTAPDSAGAGERTVEYRRLARSWRSGSGARSSTTGPPGSNTRPSFLRTPSRSRKTTRRWRRNATRGSRIPSCPMCRFSIASCPPTIRIHAWSPVRADFSSRFDCVYRHYKYFFPAGPPSLFLAQSSCSSSAIAEAASTRLDIGRMRDAAARLVGEHDFRNLCKIDASKQITNYRRRIDGVSIDRVSSHWPTQPSNINDTPEGDEEMYVLNLRGTAFLYHQVRNIMAILFLVGARLEEPSVVEELMNTHEGAIAADRVKMQLAAQAARQGDGVQWWLPVNATATTTGASPTDAPMWVDRAPTHAEDGELEIYATKPNYEMASDRPLVLWECGFLPTDVEWRVGAYDGSLSQISVAEAAEDAWAASSALLRVHKTWTQQAVSTELARHFVLASAPPHGTLPSRTRFRACRLSLSRLPGARREPRCGQGCRRSAREWHGQGRGELRRDARAAARRVVRAQEPTLGRHHRSTSCATPSGSPSRTCSSRRLKIKRRLCHHHPSRLFVGTSEWMRKLHCKAGESL